MKGVTYASLKREFEADEVAFASRYGQNARVTRSVVRILATSQSDNG